MTIRHFFDWYQLIVLICLLLLAVRRMLWLRTQGVQVLVADRQRSGWQMMADILMAIALLLWGGEIIAQACFHHMLLTSALPVIMPADGIAVKLLGALIEGAGLCIYGIALRDLGVSWRLGIDRTTSGPLVTTGIYRRMRHPIYVSFDFLFVGTVLVMNQSVFLALTVIMIPLLNTVMHREEQYLTQRFGTSYLDYCTRVGRYWTWK